MLAQDARDNAGDVRRSEAVARCGDAALVEPGDVDADPRSAELDGRVWVVVEVQRVLAEMGGHREHRCVLRRVAGPGDVVDRAHQHDVAKVREVGDLVEQAEVILLAGAQAHVDDVHAVLDRPAHTRGEDRTLAGQPAAQHAHAEQLASRRQRTDDPGACGAVTEDVAVLDLGDARVRRRCVGVVLHDDSAADGADRRVARVDAAVDHRHANARPGCALEGPPP